MNATLVARACIALALLLIVLGGAVSGHGAVALFSVFLGGLWLINTFLSWYSWSTFSFLGLLICAALLSVWQAEWWALSATIFLVSAWDFDAFSARLKEHHKIEHGIEKAHLRQIGLIALVGFILGSIPLVWRFSLALSGALLLAIILIIVLVLSLRTGGRTAG